VTSEQERLAKETGLVWEELPAERAEIFWHLSERGALGGPVTIRLGALLDGLEDTLDLLRDQLDEGLVSAGVGTGNIRWAGDAAPDRLLQLRRLAATREIPVTLERAPWPLRHAVGHFGAYREGVGQLVGRLRDVFDPKGAIAVALEGPDA
jgi:hypothetical protein